MNDTKELQIAQPSTYSRRSRESRETMSLEEDLNFQEQKQEESRRLRQFHLGASHHFKILLLSILVTALAVVLPYMASFMTEYHQFNLYTGMMMARNQLPYSDVFTTGGFLFYGIIGLSQVLGSQLYLLGVQFLALYVSGIYLSKIILFYTDNASASMAGGLAFYLANLTLGFGGFYPMQWASPFVLMGLWYLIRYFAEMTKDEGFILYGVNAALALFFEPRTLIFWVIAFVLLSGYNIVHKRLARGFYQNLAITFGLMVVFYTVGYFVFTFELIVPYLRQVLFYNFTHLSWGINSLWQTALLQIGLAFFSGLLLGAIVFFEYMRKVKTNRLSSVLIFLSLLVYIILAALSKSWAFYQLLPALPFGIILTIISLAGFAKQRASRRHSHRRQEAERSLWGTFIFSHLCGPLALIVIAAALPFYRNMQETKQESERIAIANYLKDNIADEESVVVVDHQIDIYLLSERRTATHYPVSSLYQASDDRIKDFEDDFLSSQSQLVIVNNGSVLSESVQDNLTKYYTQLSLDGVEHFTVYQLK
ncbi:MULTISPECIES: hypothetical protein [Streptococcus]|uniref:DUF2079 domain-containing protein n=1 Tax=Streptococcus caledonicus TaxID=2614158 RepID=A0ABW0UAR5_9STRE|nr:hypothetical protein [Streptococcus sp. S784/96/1]